MSAANTGKGAAIVAALAYALLWGGATAYLYATGGDWSSGVAVIVIFGAGLGGAAWLLTQGARAPRMMSLGVHLRIIGRPGRIGAYEEFLRHAAATRHVWIATRREIAAHYAAAVGAA